MKVVNQSKTIGKKAVVKRSASQRFCDVAKSATSSMKWKGTPNDKVFLKHVRVGCPFCRIDARPKAYDNLWKLRIHFQRDHGFTYSCQNLMATLENLVERKVIL